MYISMYNIILNSSTFVVSVVGVWDSTNGLIYMICGSGVEVSLGIMGVEVTVVMEGLLSKDGFDLGESVSSAELDFDGC